MFTPDTKNIYIGLAAVTKVFQGGVLVWPKVQDIITGTSIWSSGDTVTKRVVLPYRTTPYTRFEFVGRLLATNDGTIFGGMGAAGDSYDYRLIRNRLYFYLDIGAYRIASSNPMDAMSGYTAVSTSNFALSATNVNPSYNVSVTGSTVQDVPSLQAMINIRGLIVNSFKMYEGNTLLFDGVPAKRTSDNQIGLYDNVGGEFHPAQVQDNIHFET